MVIFWLNSLVFSWLVAMPACVGAEYIRLHIFRWQIPPPWYGRACLHAIIIPLLNALAFMAMRYQPGASRIEDDTLLMQVLFAVGIMMVWWWLWIYCAAANYRKSRN